MERKIVIYGAGERGKEFYNYLESKGFGDIVYGFCDRKYQDIEKIENIRVYGYEQIKTLGLHYVVTIADELERNEVCKIISKDGNTSGTFDSVAEILGTDRVTFNRDLCAYFHKKGMDSYFARAEETDQLAVFWNENSPFYQRFLRLDTDNIIELACGRGRHVPKYISMAKQITLVDILPENIEYCKHRFAEFKNITYYCNNGYSLEKLESNSYSALFCYDAMVHFEMLDIYEYLTDIFRVLKKGGYALIHHSNNGKDYKAAFASTLNGRSFMTKEVFAYLAYRAGFEIIDQKVIDWQIEDIDCISLIKKI